MLSEGFKIEKKLPQGFVLDTVPKGFTLDKPEDPTGLERPPQQMAEEMMGQITGPEPTALKEAPFMAKSPTLYAIGKTLEAIPETIAHGITLGLSSKVKEVAHIAATGEALPEEERYEAIPSKAVGELTGAVVPIGAVGKAITAPIIKTVSKSKHLQPFARMIGWGTAGSAYSTAESMVADGELPSPKEIAKHGAAWAAFEGVISSLGWGGRLTLGVNRLAKTWGIPRKEVLKTVMAEAKTRGMPIAKYAYAKAGVQKSLKLAEAQSAKEFVEGIETLSKPFEKRGTYQDLTRQLADKEVSSRIKAFNEYAKKSEAATKLVKPITEIPKLREKPKLLPSGQGFKLVGEPTKPRPKPITGLVKPITKVQKLKEQVRLLPPGQEFITKPVTKLRKAPRPTEISVLHKPTIVKTGKPYQTLQTATSAFQRKKLDPKQYQIIPYKEGYAIQKLGRVVKPEPMEKRGVRLGFGPAGELQKMYETLRGKVKSRIKLRENKYAGSVNVKKQKIQQPYKEFQQEVSALAPKKTQTWDMTGKLSREIVADYKKGAKVLTKAKKGQALTAVEIDAVRQINVNAINKLKEIAETKAPEQMNKLFTNYVDDIFKPLSNASSEAGRALNIHKKEVSVQRIAKAFSKIKKGLNARQLKEFKELNVENPLEVQRFLNRLPDPKLRDYFYEYWYNSILSGVPTHIVNVASNTGWATFQLLVHRPLKALLDVPIAALTGRQRRYYLNETIPALIGYKRAFKKGALGAKEMIMKGNISKFETKWAREIGTSVLGAFERSPHKILRKTAPFIAAPTRALRAMDIWANTMAYDSHIAALARRAANVKGLKGNARKSFERKLMLNPTEEMINKSTHFAKHLTFTDDPGKFTEWIIQGRDKVPFGRIIIPFVNTIANLTKRGVEMTPGLGLTLARGKEPAKILAKQIEGSVLGLYILSKLDKGEITGAAPKSKAARDAFYRQGKKPWGIRIGDTWYQYRRIEPFNTVIASVAIAHDAIQNAKDDETRTEIFGTMVEGLAENVIDSSYLQGVTNILDRYGRRKGMLERTTASFVPYSSFWRSINRAADVAFEGKTLVRDTKSLLGAFSQVIPGLSDKAPARLNVWGEEIPIEGGVFRQWLPYKWSKEKEDATEKMLESLEIYPGLPKQQVTIKGQKVKLPDNIYRNYCISYGHKAKKILDKTVSKPSFKHKKDELKIKQLDSIMTTIRYRELERAKREYTKKTKGIKIPEGFTLD